MQNESLSKRVSGGTLSKSIACNYNSTVNNTLFQKSTKPWHAGYSRYLSSQIYEQQEPKKKKKNGSTGKGAWYQA